MKPICRHWKRAMTTLARPLSVASHCFYLRW
nr:MAG TPA: hypothetical protein [Caudoviricetes sp.]